MKKIFLTLVAMLTICGSAFATAEKQVSFIYVHGANQGPAKDFQKCIDKMHPYIVKDFESDTFITQHFLKDATIDKTAYMLYWADKTHASKDSIKKELELSKKYTNGAVLSLKEFLAEILHDAIWIQKYSNMFAVINDLHVMVMDNYKQGKQSVLVGYSAGTFITYQYMLNKYKLIRPIMVMKELKRDLNLTDADIKSLEKYAPKYTCFAAMIETNMAYATLAGNIKMPSDKKTLKDGLIKLKKQTELSCVPDDATIGVLNIGSPVTVFYPDLVKENSTFQLMSLHLLRYMVENNKFFITLSYAKDPFGIPYANITYEELEQKLHRKIKNNGGFAYNSIIKGGKNPAIAHSLYWMKPSRFTKRMTKVFEEGYDTFYNVDKK